MTLEVGTRKLISPSSDVCVNQIEGTKLNVLLSCDEVNPLVDPVIMEEYNITTEVQTHTRPEYFMQSEED